MRKKYKFWISLIIGTSFLAHVLYPLNLVKFAISLIGIIILLYAGYNIRKIF